MSRAKPPKRSRSATERRRPPLQEDFTWGLASQVGKACDRWLLAHGQSLDAAAWKKTPELKIDFQLED
jgi:hypothetical protein